MGLNARQEKLFAYLHQHNSAKITDLALQMNVSMMTIRRDVDLLESAGRVIRYHGGVSAVKNDALQPSFYERIDANRAEKETIGRYAATLIQPGSSVYFDAGTTPLAVASHIPQGLCFTAITPGIFTASALCAKPHISVIQIGGNLHHTSYSAVGHQAVKQIQALHADLAFISTRAIILPVGTFEAELPLIEIKNAIVAQAQKVILLADNSKFQARSMCRAIALERIDCILTDCGLSESIASAFGKLIIRIPCEKR